MCTQSWPRKAVDRLGRCLPLRAPKNREARAEARAADGGVVDVERRRGGRDDLGDASHAPLDELARDRRLVEIVEERVVEPEHEVTSFVVRGAEERLDLEPAADRHR